MILLLIMEHKNLHSTWECVTPFVGCKVRNKEKPLQRNIARAIAVKKNKEK